MPDFGKKIREPALLGQTVLYHPARWLCESTTWRPPDFVLSGLRPLIWAVVSVTVATGRCVALGIVRKLTKQSPYFLTVSWKGGPTPNRAPGE